MPSVRSGRFDYAWLAVIVAAVSVLSFFYFYRHDEILLYGDAVAHINIARRVFDSRTPGLLALGTVWLPLPHFLSIPFVISDRAWRSGAGGAVVSMIAYVAGALGMARLFWNGGLVRPPAKYDSAMRAGGWFAALVYGLNPNLIYLQSTAMTESLALALCVWTIVFFAEFLQARERAALAAEFDGGRAAALGEAGRALTRCAVVLAAAMLTRYDNWLLAAALAPLAGAALYAAPRPLSAGGKAGRRLRWALLTLVLSMALAGGGWLAYNFAHYGNALEFATGPYSAKAIAAQTRIPGAPALPGHHDLKTAAVYYFEAAKLNLGEGRTRWPLLLVALSGALLMGLMGNSVLLLLLWLPLGFYSLAIAYGEVPVFIPTWWPFSYYNVRYGLELLPAFAAGAGVAAVALQRRVGTPRGRWAISAGLAVVIGICYGQAGRSTPICLREARVNSVTRIAFERELAGALAALPSGGSLLMFSGNYAGALQRAGIHLSRTVNETNHPAWEQALANPAGAADFIVAVRGDPVWQAVAHAPDSVIAVTAVRAAGREAILYRAR